MLKRTRSPDVSELEVKNGNGEIVEFGVSDSEELAKKSEKLLKGLKLSKLGNSKGKNLAKSKKLSKMRIHLIWTLKKPVRAS